MNEILDVCIPRDYACTLAPQYREWIGKVLASNVDKQCRKCTRGVTQANYRCNLCNDYDPASYDYMTRLGTDMQERRLPRMSRPEYDAWLVQLNHVYEGKPCPGCTNQPYQYKIDKGFCINCQFWWPLCFDPALPRCRFRFQLATPKLHRHNMIIIG